MGYISLLLILNAILGITSCFCIILKLVILHDAIKTIQKVFFVFFQKNEQKPVSCKKTVLFKKKTCGLVFF